MQNKMLPRPPARLFAPSRFTLKTLAMSACEKFLWTLYLLVHLFRRLGLPLKRLEMYLLQKARSLYAKHMNLPPVIDAEVSISTVETPVTSDINLKGTLFLPANASETNRVPVICVRTPYDRRNPMLGLNWARIFAERGFACLVQDTRGRFGSGGDFFPVANEVTDGGATVDWLAVQPWCNGKVGTFGVSYLGLTAYAAAGGSTRKSVSAIVPLMASARLYPVLFHDGSSFALDLVTRWLWIVLDVMHSNPIMALVKILTPSLHLDHALTTAQVALNTRDQTLLGKELHFYQDLVNATHVSHPYWSDKDVLCDLSKQTAAVSILAGFHDFFSAQSFRDFEMASKVKTDNPLELTVGPWSHWDLRYLGMGLDIALEVFSRHLKTPGEAAAAKDDGDTETGNIGALEIKPGQNRPIRVNVYCLHSNSKESPRGKWLTFSEWPPAQSKPVKLLLASGGRMVEKYSGGELHTEHTFNPKDATPHFGGPSFDPFNSGKVRQNALEARNDVLTFSSVTFKKTTMVVGVCSVTIHLWSSNPHTDLFVKLCHVCADGKSHNLIEKMTRLDPSMFDNQGHATVQVQVGSIAAMFAPGEKCRVQVSGGAHPTYLRHHGTGEPMASATTLVPAKRRVWHSESCQSFVKLPILEEGGADEQDAAPALRQSAM